MNITGNWELTAKTTGGDASIGVYLTSNAGSVSGIALGPSVSDNLCSPNGCCGSPIGIFKTGLTGTVDADGNLKLSTVAGGSPTFAMSGTVNGSAMTNGSFTVAGTCNTQGTMTGTEYAPLDGTYSGTLTSQVTGQSFAISATLDQSSSPNASGYLTLTGTATVSGNSCFSSGPVAISSTFVGNEFITALNNSQNATLGLDGDLTPGGNSLTVDYGFTPGNGTCTDDYGLGTLALQ